MVISKKTIFSKVSEGGGGGGSSIFQEGGGVQMLYISKKTHKICDFSGGSGATIQPLDPRMYPFALNFGLGPGNWRKCRQTQWLLNVLSTFYVKF